MQNISCFAFMKTTLLILLFAIYGISVSAQVYDANWDIRIREESRYGIALSHGRLLDMATDEARELGTVGTFDSVQFVHEMNGYWYVFTDKGGEGYVKGLRYRPIDLDSIRMAPILAERALLAAKEKAARDSVLALERITKAYALYDSVTARRLLDKNLWVGMTKDMALISIGEPSLICNPDALAPCLETWDYPQTALQFRDGQLDIFVAKADEVEPNLSPDSNILTEPILEQIPALDGNPTGYLTNPEINKMELKIASQ